MKTVTTELCTEAVYSDDGVKRFLLRKTWDLKLPKLEVIMLCAGSAGAVELDMTTQLVLNNASRLGYGSVAIVNLFATLNDFSLKKSGSEDSENVEAILSEAAVADKIVYAPGTGKAKNKCFAEVQEKVLSALLPFEDKLCCLCDEKGGNRLLHPLSPRLRVWHLSSLSISELINAAAGDENQKKSKSEGSGKTKVKTKNPCPD